MTAFAAVRGGQDVEKFLDLPLETAWWVFLEAVAVDEHYLTAERAAVVASVFGGGSK